MSFNIEEIMAHIGLDTMSMQRSTQVMLQQQAKAADEWKGNWVKAQNEWTAAEIKANEMSLARLKTFQAAKLNATKEFFEAQSATYAEKDAVAAIGQGSIPEGWTKKAEKYAEGAALTGAGMAIGAKAAKAAGEAKEVEGGAGVSRESFVLIRELVRGSSVSRILGSLMRLISLIADIPLIPVAIGSAIAYVIMEYVPRLWNGTTVGNVYESIKGAYQGNKDLKVRERETSEMLNKRIEEMSKAGVLSPGSADYLKHRLDTGGEDGLNEVLTFTNRKMADLTRAETRKDFERNAAKTAKENEIEQEKKIKEIQKEAADAKKKADEEHKEALEDEEQRQSKISDLQNQEARLREDYNRGSLEEDMPTLADLAGGRYMHRLNWWKRYNLGTGSGPFAGIAQDVERSKAMIQWNIEHGNASFDAQGDLTGGNAYDWLQRKTRDIGQLRAAGLRDDRLDQMNEHLAALRADIASVKRGGKLAVDIAGVSDSGG